MCTRNRATTAARTRGRRPPFDRMVVVEGGSAARYHEDRHMRSLTRGEQKSLALHRAVAIRLRTEPSLLAVAKQRLEWLRARNPAGARHYDEWAGLLDGPLDTLIEAMISPSEPSCALRHDNPFVDLVNQTERARIYRETVAALDHERPS